MQNLQNQSFSTFQERGCALTLVSFWIRRFCVHGILLFSHLVYVSVFLWNRKMKLCNAALQVMSKRKLRKIAMDEVQMMTLLLVMTCVFTLCYLPLLVSMEHLLHLGYYQTNCLKWKVWWKLYLLTVIGTFLCQIVYTLRTRPCLKIEIGNRSKGGLPQNGSLSPRKTEIVEEMFFDFEKEVWAQSPLPNQNTTVI